MKNENCIVFPKSRYVNSYPDLFKEKNLKHTLAGNFQMSGNLGKLLIPALKGVSAKFSLVRFKSLKESTCKTRKNVFYFISKALSIPEKIKF